MKPNLQSILQVHGDSYLEKNHATWQQQKVISALSRCQTGELGHLTYECNTCHSIHTKNCSCGNRHCPLCQGDKTLKWIQTQENKKLPVEYFFTTFTVPMQLRPLIYRLREKAYRIMFRVTADVIRKILLEKYKIKTSGFTSVLHTWGGQLQFHPHIHMLIPGGGLDENGQWKFFPLGFGVPVKAASKLWKAQLLHELEKEVGRSQLPQKIYPQAFVTHCKSAGDGRAVLRYLSRYVFKTAIDNRRITGHTEDKVTFTWKEKDTKKKRSTSLRPQVFIRRFLQHVLDSGFTRVRHYGFLHPNSKIDLNKLRLLITQFSDHLLDFIPEKSCDIIEKKIPRCPTCQSPLVLVAISRETHHQKILKDTG